MPYYELEGQSFLDASSVGLLPFTPLMRPPVGMTAATWIERCVETTRSVSVDSQTRGTLLFALSLLGSLAHNPEYFEQLISEEIMRESPFYDRVVQRGIEQGIEQGVARGAREASIGSILRVLTARFPQHNPQPVKQALDTILDLDRLSELVQTAALTPSFEAFLQTLDV